MRNSAIILAALITATPTLAADQCTKVEIKHMAVGEPTYAKYADTAHCFLRVDGKIIIDGMCTVSISQNSIFSNDLYKEAILSAIAATPNDKSL